jgi:hypothetical protein
MPPEGGRVGKRSADRVVARSATSEEELTSERNFKTLFGIVRVGV